MEDKLDRKSEIQMLIAKADLDNAFQLYLNYTSTEELLNLHNIGVNLFAQYNQFKKDNLLGVVDYDDLARTRNRINLAFLDLVNNLPAITKKQEPNKRTMGIRESKLKRYVLRFMVASKVLVLTLLFILWDSGGFTVDQFIGTASLLIPLFTAYTVLMVRDSTYYRYVHIKPEITEKLVTHHFKNMAYFWLVIYTLAIALVLILKPAGTLDFKQMSAMLTLVEIGIGVYVGEIVFVLFKKQGG